MDPSLELCPLPQISRGLDSRGAALYRCFEIPKLVLVQPVVIRIQLQEWSLWDSFSVKGIAVMDKKKNKSANQTFKNTCKHILYKTKKKNNCKE